MCRSYSEKILLDPHRTAPDSVSGQGRTPHLGTVEHRAECAVSIGMVGTAKVWRVDAKDTLDRRQALVVVMESDL